MQQQVGVPEYRLGGELIPAWPTDVSGLCTCIVLAQHMAAAQIESHCMHAYVWHALSSCRYFATFSD